MARRGRQAPAWPRASRERGRALEALFRLDAVEAVADYVGVPAPFDVRRWMRAATRLYLVPADPIGHLIYVEDEDPGRGGADLKLVSEAAVDLNEPDLAGTLKSSSYDLPVLNPGADGFRLHLLISSIPESSNILLVGPATLAVRLPRSVDLGLAIDRPVWFAVEVRGALARPARSWSLRHARSFEGSGRAYIRLREAWLEPLAVKRPTAAARCVILWRSSEGRGRSA